MNNKGKIAISEILVLLIGIIAFAYAVGGGIGFVKAQEDEAAATARAREHLFQGLQLYGAVGGSKTPKSSTPTPTSGSGWNPGNLFKYGDTGAQQYYDKLVKEAFDKEYLDAYKAWENANKEVLEAQKKVSEAVDKTGEWVPDDYFELEDAQTKAAEAKNALDAKEKEIAKEYGEKLKGAEPTALSKVWDGLVSSVAYGVAAYSISALALEMFGADASYKRAIPPALGAAFFAGRGSYLLFKEGVFGKGAVGYAGYAGVGIGVLVFAWVYSEMYKEESFKVTTFNCYSWKAPTGGEYCYKCNEQDLPCSEYQCKSLGQSCELLNDEDSGNQFCAHVNKNDVRPPTIQVRPEALLKDYTYSDDGAISPPSSGVIIEYAKDEDGCIPAFAPLTFGIKTIDEGRDEPAVCRVDTERVSFDNMRYAFEYPEEYRINHTFTISLPSIDSLEDENLTLENNGEFEIYTKCMDANGNENVNDFVFKFCVQKGPDTQVPYAVGSNIGNGMPVPSGQESFDFELYVNEPAECKWSHGDREYDNMENQMDCSEEYDEYNNQMIWICYTTLTGIKDKQENKFYFKCTDSDMNINSQDLFYEDGGFVIMGTHRRRIIY
jgi:hypothetical protein